MAWIESHQSLRDHPKLMALCRITKWSRPRAIGHLHCLWWWALEYAEDGNLASVDAEDISSAMMIEPDTESGNQDMVALLMRVGFIDADKRLHDWMEYAGRLVKERQRKRKERKQKRGNGVRGPSADVQGQARTCADKTAPTVPYRTVPEPNPTEPTPSPPAPERPKRIKRVPSTDPDFEAFYVAYPWKSKPLDAEKAWSQTKDRRPPIEELLKSLETHKASWDWTKEGGRWIPLPASWLRSGGWASVPRQPPAPGLFGSASEPLVNAKGGVTTAGFAAMYEAAKLKDEEEARHAAR